MKTVVVEKNGVKKTINEEYKNDYIVAGWKEVLHVNNTTYGFTGVASSGYTSK